MHAALALLCVIAMAGCSSIQAKCKFGPYDAAFRDDVVVPYLQRVVGENYIYFNYERPLISVRDGNVAYIMSSSKIIDGKSFFYHRSIYVMRDCSSGGDVRIEELE